MKLCDRCHRVDMSVERSRLKVPGVIPKGRCGCIFLCLTCRDLLIAQLNGR